MTCNKCGGKSKIVDTVNVKDDNETYRKHKCVECGRVFYTTEIEIVPDDLYIDNWYDNYRKKKEKENV